MKNVVITGGGTGGHLFASLAFAEYIKHKGYNPVIIGSVFGIESRVLKNYDFEYMLLKTKGFAGKNILQKTDSMLKFSKSFQESLKYIKSKKPQFAVGFGGYTTIPVISASKLLGVPTVIVEQNAVCGKANRLMSKFSDLVFVNFESTKQYFNQKKTYVTGNPVRNDIFMEHRDFDKDKITVGVLGGSRGSRSINNAMIELAENYDIDVNVLHQTGKEDFDRVKEIYKINKPDWKAFDFINDMKSFYENIDFIICRAGAGTLSEITCAALGSLLIPYPYAIYNHQYYNSLELVNAGCSTIMEDKNLSGKSLKSVILSLSKKRLKSLSDNAKLMCKRDVCSVMLKTIKNKIIG